MRRAALLTASLTTAAALAGCGGGATQKAPGPSAHSAADRAWIDGAKRFVDGLDSDILLVSSGGANLASARRALDTDNNLYDMLVAYTEFGQCGAELANVGTPGPREASVVKTLIAACVRLQRAAALFEKAAAKKLPKTLLAATSLALNTAPLLSQARNQLFEVSRS